MPLTLLVVGAHIDDCEYGIGGIIIKAVEAGHRVVAVTVCSDYSTWPNTVGREEQCKKDQLDLAKRFGYEKVFLDYPYHRIFADVELMSKLSNIYMDIEADITFVHNKGDNFPDHVVCGEATDTAVRFNNGLAKNTERRVCPRIFSFCLTDGQTTHFEPDFFFRVTDVMPQYMELIQGTDGILRGEYPKIQEFRKVVECKNGKTLTLSSHGWQRMIQCSRWARGVGEGSWGYAIGLKTIHGPRDGRPLW